MEYLDAYEVFNITGKYSSNGVLGFCVISGSVKKNNKFCAFNVHLYETEAIGGLVDFLTSGVSHIGVAEFSLSGIPYGKFLVVARDLTGVSNAVVADSVLSELPVTPFRFIPAGGL